MVKMKRQITILIIISLGLFNNCEKLLSPYGFDTVISSGTFFGECGGYCKNEIEIRKNKVTFTASGWDSLSYPNKTIHGKISKTQFNTLVNLIDSKKIISLDNVIGCPDCVDGGGEWIEIDNIFIHKKITFEYGDTIESIQDLIDKIREIRNRFNKQMFP